MDPFGSYKEYVGTILDLDVHFVGFNVTCNIHNTIKDVQSSFKRGKSTLQYMMIGK